MEFVVSSDPSSWAFGWEALVAIGTLTLALATGVLGLQTRALSRAAVSEVEGNIRPVLIDVPRGLSLGKDAVHYEGERTVLLPDRSSIDVGDADGMTHVSVPLRNVGSGLAFVLRVHLGRAEDEFPWGGKPSQLTVPVGEIVRVRFSFAADSQPGADFVGLVRGGSLRVRVFYSDLGAKFWMTTLQLAWDDEGSYWRVTGVQFEQVIEFESGDLRRGPSKRFLAPTLGRPEQAP